MSSALFVAPDSFATDRIRLRSWMPWSPKQPAEEAESNVRRFRAQWLLAENFVMPVLSADGRRVLGGTGFHVRQGPIEGGAIEVGMWIRAEESGAGLGAHVLDALVRWSWAEWPWRRLVWKCDSHNVASRRVAEKLGFTLEGTLRQDGFTPQGALRDSCIYALLKP